MKPLKELLEELLQGVQYPGEEYDFEQGREQYIAEMKRCGMEIKLPAADELQLDLDSGEDICRFLRSWPIFARYVEDHYEQAPEFTECPSRSGLPRRHVYIKVPFTMSVHERIAWQAALGSDPVRELLSLVRSMYGDQHPTLLVERGPGYDPDLDLKNLLDDLE